MIATTFSRAAFEEALDPKGLGDELARVVLRRLMSASDAEAEARAVVGDLRAIGHDLFSWDESTSFIIWGDDYTRRANSHRLTIYLRWPEDGSDDEGFDVEVTFDAWPER